MKKALFVWGGWDGHEPRQCTDIFAPIMEKEGYDVEISDTLDVYLNPENMLSKDLIVQVWTMGKITNEQLKGLQSAVSAGVGFGGWHGGMCVPEIQGAIWSPKVVVASTWLPGSTCM